MRRKIIYFMMSFTLCFMQSCSTEEAALEGEATIKTVGKEEAIFFLKSQNSLPNNTSKTINFTFEFEKITQEKTSHKEALITVIPVKYDTKGKKTCVILWKVDNTIETIIYNEYASESSTITSFTGIIIMTRLNGDFVRAYKLKNNDYVIDLVPIKKDAISKSSNSLNENPLGLQEVIVINDFKKTSYTFVPMIDGSNKTVSDLEDYYWLKSGGGGASPEPMVEEEKDPCSIAKNMTKDALDSTYISAKISIETASVDGFEHSITLGRDSNGQITKAPMNNGTSQYLVLTNTSWPGAFAALHNHPGNTPLSSGDIYTSVKLGVKNSNFATTYVLTNGEVYAIVVTDLVAAQDFVKKYPAVNLPNQSPEFPDDIFYQIDDLKKVMGYSNEGRTNAIAFVLDKFNAGISLLKQDSSGNFIPIKPVETLQNSTVTYTSKPCN